MRSRFAVLVLTLLVTAFPAYTVEGNAWLVTDTAVWMATGNLAYAVAIGTPLIYKSVPYVGPGRLIMPSSPRVFVFHDRHTMSWWNGIPTYYGDPGKAYTDIFTDDAQLTDILQMRSGRFLVAEAASDHAKLIEFDLNGKIGEIPFDGADHIELLGEQCTLLYTNHDEHIRQMNICTGQREDDFAVLLPEESAGALRQLPTGDVIVAAGNDVLQFRGPAIVADYVFPGVTHVALSADGATFWAAGLQNHSIVMRNYDPAKVTFNPIAIGNPGMQPPASANAITDLTVESEWRASMLQSRSRGVRRR